MEKKMTIHKVEIRGWAKANIDIFDFTQIRGEVFHYDDSRDRNYDDARLYLTILKDPKCQAYIYLRGLKTGDSTDLSEILKELNQKNATIDAITKSMIADPPYERIFAINHDGHKYGFPFLFDRFK